MEKISSDILALISEAAVLIKAGKISFANSSARTLLGEDCCGKNAAVVFGQDIKGCQATSFIAEFSYRGSALTARVLKTVNEELVFISQQKNPDSILNEPFLCAIRNSLMSIALSVNLLRSKAENLKDSESLEKLSILSQHYYRISRLVNNASFILKDESPADCNISTVNLSRLYAELIHSVEFCSGGVKINADLGTDLFIDCDAELIKRLLLNLISNCFTHAKGCTQISVRLTDTPENLILSVSDDGCGMESDELRTVFERYRYGFNISDMGKGSGMGMSVARRIARMHGGTLLFESRKNIGTTVRVSLGKKHSAVHSLHSPKPENNYIKEDILLEFSHCLGPEYYSEKYMD